MAVTLLHYCDNGHQNTLVLVRSKQDPRIIDQIIFTVCEMSACERIYITDETYSSGEEYIKVYNDDLVIRDEFEYLQNEILGRFIEIGIPIEVEIDMWYDYLDSLKSKTSITLQELEPIGFFNTDTWHRMMSKCKIRAVEYPASTSKA